MVNQRQNLTALTSFLMGILAVTGIFLLLRQPFSVKAEVAGVPRYVRMDGSDGGNTCTSSASPCRTVQYAVDQSTANDEIRVATGIYTGVQARDSMTQVVYISKTVTIRGGYNTTFTTYDPQTYPTTLDAQGQGRVVSIIEFGEAPLLEGLTLTGGNADGITANCPNNGGIPDGCGGGIFIYGASPTIANNIIIHNVAASSTIGHYASGGGLCLSYAYNTIITGNLIISNTASLGERGMGGGIDINISSGAQIEANQVLSNLATTHASLPGWGGGIAIYGSGATIQDNLIQGNRENGGGNGQGAGLYTWNGSNRFAANQIISNHGQWAVLLGYYDGGTFEANQVVNNNTSGGIELVSGKGQPLTLTNNIVSQSGSTAIVLNASSNFPQVTHLLHNTLVGDGVGYGLYVETGYVSLSLTNTVLSGYTWGITNTTPLSSSVDADYTLFWGNTHDGIPGSNPLYGNPVFMNPTNHDYHLGTGSAAIDAGIQTSVKVDMDGDTRPIGPAPDIGADEARLNIFLPLVLR
jgi:hypothetical protein